MAESIPTTNKIVANLNGTSIYSDTAHGAAAVKKITHPPTTIPVEYCGYPDDSSANVVLMEVKGVTNVAPILTYPTSLTATKTVNTSEIMFLTPNGGKVASYVFLKMTDPPSGTNAGWVQPVSINQPTASGPTVSNINSPSVNNAGYNWVNFSQDVASFRTCYKSQTYYLNSTDFNNQGEVTTASFKPSVLLGTSYSALKSKHLTCSASNKSLNDAINCVIRLRNLRGGNQTNGNGDFEIVDTYPTEYAFQVIEIDRPDASFAAIPFTGGCMYSHRNLFCDNMSDVMNSSSKSATRPAREGSFEVHAPAGPIMDWIVPGAGSASIAPTPANSGPIISLVRSRIGNSYYYFPLLSDNVTASGGTNVNYSGDIPWNNLDWKISIWSGLTMPASTGTTLSSVPYITVKSFAGMEIQPQFNSSLRPFQKSRCPPDDKARRMITTIFHERPDSLPASANDLASIASTAVKFLPTAVSWLKDLFGNNQQKNSAMEKAKKFVGSKQTPKRPKRNQKKNMRKEIQQAANTAVNRMAKLSIKQQPLPTVSGQPRRPPRGKLPRGRLPRVVTRTFVRSRSLPR